MHRGIALNLRESLAALPSPRDRKPDAASLPTGDFNRDGRVDIAVATLSAISLRVLYGRGRRPRRRVRRER
jgi:hypothetical protein